MKASIKKTADLPPSLDDTFERAKRIAGFATEMKSSDIAVLDLRALTSFTDYFVICTGASNRQVTAIADAIRSGMKALGLPIIGSEGEGAGQWILLDFGAVVAHIFHPESRAYYQVEKLWIDAPRISLPGITHTEPA